MNDRQSASSSTSSIPPVSDHPQHVAIIMDGNGRWAKARGLPRVAGHKKGKDSVRAMVEACGEFQIPYLTLFAFSSENWRRPKTEIRLLMELFLGALEHEVAELHANGVRFRVVGDIGPFGSRIVTRIREAENLTANNRNLTLTVAANYGGRWDITQACRQLMKQVTTGQLSVNDITPENLEPYLSMSGIPEPDLFIRTGGEQRISNFLLWQLAYTELYFTPVLWPDFGRDQLAEAVRSFAGRQRRFGQTGDQVEAQRSAQSVRTGTGPDA